MNITIHIDSPYCREQAERDALQLRALANTMTSIAADLPTQAEVAGPLMRASEVSPGPLVTEHRQPEPDGKADGKAPADKPAGKGKGKGKAAAKPPADKPPAEDPPADKPKGDDSTLTFQDVMAAFGELQKAGGNDAVRDLLTELGAVSTKDGKARVSALKESQWESAIEQAHERAQAGAA